MFQIDDDCFPIEEGSVVRVAPEGARNIYNSSDEERVQKDALWLK